MAKTNMSTWTWNKNAADGKPIVSKDGGATWTIATAKEIATRDAEAAAPVPAALAPVPAELAPAPATPTVAPDGKTATVGAETLDITGQTVNADSHPKKAEISLHSPTDPKGGEVRSEGDYERMFNVANARAEKLEGENKQLRVFIEQLTNANDMANAHLKQLRGQSFDSLGLPKVTGVE